MDIVAALHEITPNGQFVVGEDYESLVWLPQNNIAKPTREEVLQAWEKIAYEYQWRPIRKKRNLLLSESDWTQTPDATVDKQAWLAYRKALRDVPQTFAKPEDVVWPVKP